MEVSADFEREKWLADLELRKQDLELRQREQANRDAELELKRRDQVASTWRSPLVVAILAAAVAAAGNAFVAWVNGTSQRDLEARKQEADFRLESSKAESNRILEMIKTGDTEKAAGNLEFLLKAGLVTDRELSAKLAQYLKDRTPGKGPSLPSPSPRVGFEQTEALTDSLQGKLQQLFNDYFKYLDGAGFPPAPSKVTVRIEKLPDPNAYYDPSREAMVIDTRMADDPSVALREYSHHILMRQATDRAWQGQYGAIESGIADYLACSFLDNPKLGEKAAKAFDPKAPYIRMLANERRFSEFQGMAAQDTTYKGTEIWGGALWSIRARLGRDTADALIATAWMSVSWPQSEEARARAFVTALLAAAKAKGPRELAAAEAVLRDRGFPVAR